MEGDSMIMTSMVRRIQCGSLIHKVSKNWKWEGRMYQLQSILEANPTLHFSHVRCKENKVVDVLAKKGVLAHVYFQPSQPKDSREGKLMHQCMDLANDDISHVERVDGGGVGRMHDQINTWLQNMWGVILGMS